MNPFGAPAPFSMASFAPKAELADPNMSSFSPFQTRNPTTPSFFLNNSSDLSELSFAKAAELQTKLNKKLGPEYVSQRPGAGGGRLTYAEGWRIINLANEVFGFNGWSSNIVKLEVDFMDYNEEARRYNVGVSAVVRVTLRDGTFHEDVGFGVSENQKSKGPALDKCRKEAVTDALKRSLRLFGNLMGNCLYDKKYTEEVVKIKVAPSKLDVSTLHRGPSPDISVAKPDTTRVALSTPVKSSTNASVMARGQLIASFKDTGGPSNPAPVAHTVPQVPKATNQPAPNAVNPLAPTGRVTVVPQFNSKSHNVSRAGLGLSAAGSSNGVVPPAKVATGTGVQAPSTISPPALRSIEAQMKPPETVKESGNQFIQRAQTMTTEDPGDLDGADESFVLNSEDAAMFAEMDLGEAAADLGRPVQTDEGIGGALFFDNNQDDVTTAHVNKARPRVQFAGTNDRENVGAQNQNASNAGLHKRTPSTGSVLKKSTSVGSFNLSLSKSPMGGFSFPAGDHGDGRAPTGAGLKRNAQMMSNGSGLVANKERTSIQGTRVPFAPLELDGNDFKRVRR